MKTILLLGGYGFLGTNILKHIEDNLVSEYKVIVFDKFPSSRDGMIFSCVSRSYSGDFSDSVLLDKVFRENRIDVVIHAISTTVPALSLNARYDVESNLIPTIELLNCMVRYSVRNIVYISSGGAIYGDKTGVCHTESEDVFPRSSYGVVKLAIEKYLMQYAELYAIEPLIIRLSNPYGPFHYSKFQGICNVAIESALANEKFTVWGDGESLKDYIYVCDFVNILFRIIGKGVKNEVVNVGSGCLATVNEILNQIKWRVPSFEWTYSQASQYDVTKFELNLSKLHSIIGKYDFIPLCEGIPMTMDWVTNRKG